MKNEIIINEEKIEPEIDQIHFKKEYISFKDNTKYKLIIEIENEEIIFTLNNISQISYYNYIRKYKYNDIIKELHFPKNLYYNIIAIYKYFDIKEYKIRDDKNNKIIIINNKDTIILYRNKNVDIIEKLIEELNTYKELNNKQNEKINKLIDINESKDNKIKSLEKKYSELKQQLNRIDEILYKKEINLIYEGKGVQNIFGKKFVENNKNNIELIINGKKQSLVDKFKLTKGENNIKLIIKNNITNLESMFDGCNTLKNIDELKYFNAKYCTNFAYLFRGCSLLSNINSLEYWNISNGKNFEGMFDGCTSLEDKTPIKNWYITNINNASSKKIYFEDFKNNFNHYEKNKNSFPIIDNILNNNSNIKYLQYIPKINELCNYMIDYCSYKFTRDEAQKLNIFEEINDKDELIFEFIKIYEELRPLVTNYENHNFDNNKGDKYFKYLKKNEYLANFCLDIGEFNYGMVLVSIYKKLIEYQNSFINQILNSNNECHKKCKDLFIKEIKIQNCSEKNIIVLPSKEELLQKYILKNINNNKNEIIQYHFNLIEEELASNILTNKKKFVFNNENCLRYVVYKYEGFTGNKSFIIKDYNEIYERKSLNDKEKKLIIEYIKKNKENDTKKIIDFWSFLQKLINIILEKQYPSYTLITKVIEENNKDNNLDILNELFGEKTTKIEELFTVNSIMSIFLFFELFCWEKIKENITPYYLKNINDNIKKKIDKFFENSNNKIITKVNLSTAIRRFVSRYLAGKNVINRINENNNFIYYIFNEELWDDKNIIKESEFISNLNEIFDNDKSKNMISVGHILKVQEYLGDEIQLYLDNERKGSFLFQIDYNEEILLLIEIENQLLEEKQMEKKEINNYENISCDRECEKNSSFEFNDINSNQSKSKSNCCDENECSEEIEELGFDY